MIAVHRKTWKALTNKNMCKIYLFWGDQVSQCISHQSQYFGCDGVKTVPFEIHYQMIIITWLCPFIVSLLTILTFCNFTSTWQSPRPGARRMWRIVFVFMQSLRFCIDTSKSCIKFISLLPSKCISQIVKLFASWCFFHIRLF